MNKKIILAALSVIIITIALSGCNWKKQDVNKSMDNLQEMQQKQYQEQKQDRDRDQIYQEDQQMKTSYIDINVMEAKKLIDNDSEIIIIDVSPNYTKGHLPRSINYYVGDGSLDKAIPNLDKSAAYLVYCHVDSASISGAQKLIDAGFQKVYRLEGNYKAWVDAGYPIEK